MMMPSTFAPYGASQIIAVTASDQVIALPALPAENPLIALVALQPDMADLYIKLGNSGVSGSSATSMRIKAGSVVTPLFVGVGASETHLSIFCADGPTGSVVLTPGRMLEGVATTVIADNAVTNAKLADMAQSTIKGRAAGAGTGDPTDLTAAQVKTIIAIDHGADLVGLGDDDHTQYVLLAGRAGGQILTGGTASGDDIRITSTANATKGTINLGAATTGVFIDETSSLFSIGGSPNSITVNTTSYPAKMTVHAESVVGMGVHQHTATAAFGSVYFGSRSRGTEGAETVVQNNDVILEISAVGYDGTDYAYAAQIMFDVDGTPGNNDMPGRIRFLTTADGASTPTEAMRINSDQSVQFSTIARPDANDGAALGTPTNSWSDGYFASGAVLGFDNGDVTITHSANKLLIAGGGLAGVTESFVVACSDETTAITAGTAKVTFRMPYAFTVTAVRASLTTASSSGTPTIDINEGGVSILSTKLTIDANELTSTTAASAAVISDTALADDASITIDIDTAGTGAKGLKVTIIGYRP